MRVRAGRTLLWPAVRRVHQLAVPPLDVLTLTDGGQPAAEVAARVAAFIEKASSTLELALYDIRLPGPVGDSVAGALDAACARGAQIRLLYNVDRPRPIPVPPPPATRPELVEAFPFPTRDIPGEPDLMHHKYVV